MNLSLLIIFNLAALCFTLDKSGLNDNNEHTLTSTTPIDKCELNDNIEHSLTSTTPIRKHIHMAKGFKLHVTVDKLNTKAEAMDFLLIKPGEELEDGEGSGFVFTHGLEKPKTFIVFSNDIVIVFEVDTSEPKEFSLKYKRVGEEIITTTQNPISTSTWPQPQPQDSIYLTVFVDGFPMEDYRNNTVLENFKTAVGYMASEYVGWNSREIPVVSNISGANVLIKNLKRCNYDWPDSDNCVEVRFAVPVLLDETLTNDTYQLTTKHLEPMWVRYADKYLHASCRYLPPDMDVAVTSWGLTLGLLILFFLIGIGASIVIRDKVIHYFNMKRRTSSIIDIMDFEYRDSNMSLNPPATQVFPQLFEQEQTVPVTATLPVWLRSAPAPDISEDPLDDDDIITHFDSLSQTYTLNDDGKENEAFETDT